MGGRIRPQDGLGHHPLCFLCPHPVQGVAEAELEKDIGRTLKVVIRSTRQEVGLPSASRQWGPE